MRDQEGDMIKVGIIGMGRSGWELHATFLSNSSDFKLIAVADQSAERVAKAAKTFGAKAYADPQALIGDPEVELVVVSVPSNMHVTVAVAALDAGKHVLTEKPMATTLAEADVMLAAAARNKRLLTVFHNRHWDRDFRMVKALARQGMLGELLTIDSRVMTYGPEWASYGVAEFNPTWRIQKAYGGGFLADWGPHLVEQCLDLAHAWPTSVSCQLRSQLWAKEVDDYFNLRLAFPSGLLATVEGSNNARLPLPRWFVVGREGTLIADGTWGKWTEMRVRREMGELPVDILPQGVGASSGSRSMDVGEELSAAFYADLADALAKGRAPVITAEHARDVMAILEAARRSNETGQPIKPDAPKDSAYRG
jgi:scyllo-inositol 2-dehydrogenase (NADP+)